VRCEELVERGEELFLRRHVLDDRFDDEVAILEIVDVSRRPHPAEYRIASRRVDGAFLEELVERLADARHAPLERAAIGLEDDDIAPRGRGDLRDARSHQPASADADLLDVRHDRGSFRYSPMRERR